MQNKASSLSGLLEQPLLDAGYKNIFEIVSISRAAFVQSIPSLPVNEAQAIYLQARQRAENLKSLYRSWQLRHEPVIKRMGKLNTQSNAPILEKTLVDSIGRDGDFSDIMNRASQYADAASIQSLFSPGRYATALYKVARDLHTSFSSLHIDQRRPDLQSLALSETTMNQEITSLDVLLDILQKGSQDINQLSTTFYPMTLPYDDDLSQINAALSAQARTLNGVWNTLADVTAQAVTEQSSTEIPDNSPKFFAAEVKKDQFFDGEIFYVKAIEFQNQPMIYLSHYTNGETVEGVQLIAGNPDNAAAAAIAPLKLTWSMAGQCYYLGIPDGTKTGDGKILNGCFLRGNSPTNPNQDGDFAQVANKSNSTQPLSQFHLPVTLEQNDKDKTQFYLKTHKGYIAVGPSGQTNWKNALVINGEKTDALLLQFSKDNTGTPTVPDDVVPPAINDIPSPPARETLSLTPVSYQLMTDPAPTAEDISNHYGLGSRLRDVSPLTSSLADTLNSIETFCEKTQITFNQLMELTAQSTFSQNGASAHAGSRYFRFGETDPTRVNVYGATYLNNTLAVDADSQYLWVQTDGKKLNFSDSTVVELSGWAEKLVRLAAETGLSFDELDWLIANASRSVPEHYGKIVLDKPVLEALAEYISLRQRSGLDVDTFVTFICAVNPYAPRQTASLYEKTFRSAADGNQVIALGEEVKYTLDEQDELSTLCCKALGVTSDEFFRIGSYCFDGAGHFTVDEYTVSQLYRFGAIPRLFGLTFAQAEILWRLMAGGTDILLKQLGQAKSLQPLKILRRTQ